MLIIARCLKDCVVGSGGELTREVTESREGRLDLLIMIHSHAALSAGAKSTQPRQVGLISKFLSLDFLHPRFSSRFAVFGIILMARFAALLLLAPAVLAFDYTVGVGKDETT